MLQGDNLEKKKNKILITGSLGLVGGEAVDFFKEKGWEVVGIDNNMRARFFGTTLVPYGDTALIDIREEETIDTLFENNKFDVIIHTAAQPSHDYSKDHALEDFTINALGTLILLEATRKHCPEAVFVHISTDKVYGENMQREDLMEEETRYDHWRPYDEETKVDHTMHSLFGCSKMAADLYVQEYGRYFGMKTVCFRCGCITGRNHKGAELHGFLAYLVKCIKGGITYKIFGYKGKQVRDQIHAYDLISACYEFIKNPKEGAVYNMGGGEDRSVSINEAIKLIEKETKQRAITTYIDKPRKGDRMWDIHDVSKFQKDYPNWQYKYSLENIIKDLCEN